MVETAQNLYDEAVFVTKNAEKYQRNAEYLMITLQLLLDEKPLHLDHLGEFNHKERQLRRAIKRDKRLVKNCFKARDRLMRAYFKAMRRSVRDQPAI